MKKIFVCLPPALALFLFSPTVSAQTSQTQETPKKISEKPADRGSEGAITMEEYQILQEEYQKVNPGKTFQDMQKEEFETYLTTELAKLRQRRAQELKKEQSGNSN